MYSLLDESAEIGLRHLRAGLATWHYCEASARFIFGESLGDPVADEILSLLRASEEGVTRNELIDHFKRNKSSGEIGRGLTLLQALGLAREKNEQCPPVVRFPLCTDSRDVQGEESKSPGPLLLCLCVRSWFLSE